MLVGALVVTNAFVDGLFTVIDEAIQLIASILTAEIQIPVLTWLYESVTGEKLTFLNVVTLVAAIPVTVIFRAVEGQYPSQALGPSDAMHVASTDVAAPYVQKLCAGFSGMITFGQGVINALGDGLGDALGTAGTLIAKLSAGMGLVISAFNFPLISNDNPGGDVWVAFNPPPATAHP